MSVLRIVDPKAIKPHQVVMLIVLLVVVAGGCLLLSAPESTTLVDGAKPWTAGSPLRAVVQLLCLNYALPTVHAGEVKTLLLNLGAGLGLVVLAGAVLWRSRSDEDLWAIPEEGVVTTAGEAATAGTARTAAKVLAPGEAAVAPASGDAQAEVEKENAAARAAVGERRGKAHVPPLMAAQVLFGLYWLWSLASTRWSSAPDLALGGTLLLGMQLLWAFSLGQGLRGRIARGAAHALIAIGALTGAIAIWYWVGRNPVLRAKFPFGNPLFLATCLLPGMLLALSLLGHLVAARVPKRLMWGLWALVSLGLAGGAFYLADARGPMIGLAVGFLGLVFFAVQGWRRLVPVVLVLLLGLIVSGPFLDAARAPSPTGRDATVRFRLYAWSYAWRMVEEQPFHGYGQGGYALRGDSYVVDDVEDDPLVFSARIAHAHNEWLEVMADLGSVGIVLLGAALLLSWHAATSRLAEMPPGIERWALVGVSASLVAIAVAECFGVGLRVTGVPTLFYTCLGLMWALSGPRRDGLIPRLARTGVVRLPAGLGFGIVGLVVMFLGAQEFAAARMGYQVEELLEQGSYEEAALLAEQNEKRLSPQRSLEHLNRLIRAHVAVASLLQERGEDRELRARESAPVNQGMLNLAASDYRASADHASAASRALADLVASAPGYFGQGWLEYQLRLLEARNPASAADAEQQARVVENARAAIERELRRQPFSPTITVAYLQIAAPGMTYQDVLVSMARPLRHNKISAPYVELLRRLSAAQEDNRAMALVFSRARAFVDGSLEPEDAPEDQALHRWAPEMMRLAAAVLFGRGDYEQAVQALEYARPQYEKLADAAPLGVTSFYLELAECQFYYEPTAPEKALALAELATQHAPASEMGRALAQSALRRSVDYLLASGEEEAAKRKLAEWLPGDPEPARLEKELGHAYGQLCYGLLQRRMAQVLRQPFDALPEAFPQWVMRAIELAPNDAQGRYLAADLEIREGRFAAAVDHLRIALDNGLDPRSARDFLQVARGQWPDNPILEAMWQELYERFPGLDPPPSASSSVSPSEPPESLRRPVEPEGVLPVQPTVQPGGVDAPDEAGDLSPVPPASPEREGGAAVEAPETPQG
jgi:O-antigen ligase